MSNNASVVLEESINAAAFEALADVDGVVLANDHEIEMPAVTRGVDYIRLYRR